MAVHSQHARPRWIRCISRQSLNLILLATGNQWSCFSAGVTWSQDEGWAPDELPCSGLVVVGLWWRAAALPAKHYSSRGEKCWDQLCCDFFADYSHDLFQSAKITETTACDLCDMLDERNWSRVAVLGHPQLVSWANVLNQTRSVQSCWHWAEVYRMNTSSQHTICSPGAHV